MQHNVEVINARNRLRNNMRLLFNQCSSYHQYRDGLMWLMRDLQCELDHANAGGSVQDTSKNIGVLD